jgi:hypothetical protein
MTVKLTEELNLLLLEAAATQDPTRKWHIINNDARRLFNKITTLSWREWVEAMNKERKPTRG